MTRMPATAARPRGAEALIVAMALALALAVGTDIWLGRGQAERLAAERGQAVLQGVGARMDAMAFDARLVTARSLDVLRARQANDLAGAANAQADVDALVKSSGAIRSLLVVDRSGTVVGPDASNAARAADSMLNAWVRQLRKPAPVSELQMLGVIGPGSIGVSVAMGMRATGPDGQFAGASITILDPLSVSKTLRGIDIRDGGNISIRTLSGQVVFHWPTPGSYVGGGARSDELLRHAMQNPGGGVIWHTDGATNERYLSVFRLDQQRDLLVSANFPERSVFGDWSIRTAWESAVLALVLLLAATAVVACRRSRSIQAEGLVLRETIASMRCALLRWDRDGRLLVASPSAASMLGLAPVRFEPGATRAALVRDLSSRRMEAPWTANPSLALEGLYWTLDGRTVRIEESYVSDLGAVACIADVTALLREEEFKRLGARQDAMAHLAGKLGHDFNNVLTIVLGHLDILTRTLPEGSRPATLAATALAGARRGTEMVNRVMGFAVTTPASHPPARLAGLLSSAIQQAATGLGGDVTLELEPGDTGIEAHCDEGEFQEAVLNLLLNARDSMHGHGRIGVRLVEEGLDDRLLTTSGIMLAPGRYARIDVIDSGEGIGEDALHRLFEPFYTTRPKGSGAGLGLATVFGFCRRHRGAVHVASVPGSGTKFSLYLPFATH